VVAHQHQDNVEDRKLVRMFEAKFELFCKSKFGVSFIERDHESNKDNVRH